MSVMERVHVRRRRRSGGQIGAVETVHVRRMKREGEKGEEDKCLWLKEECEKDEGRGGRRGGQICEVERVHVRRMRGEEGRANM